VPVLRRGKAIGIIGTGYQVTQALTFVVAGWAASQFGWRGALYVPAILLISAALFMLVCLKDRPEEADARKDENAASPTPPTPVAGRFIENVLITLGNPSLWLLGLALGLLNACRYGFIDWGLSHLIDTQKTGVGEAALKYALLPVGAIAGSYLAGVATDRFFGGRRAPVICILLVALGGMALVYEDVAKAGGLGIIVLLLAIGFCIFGPQVLLVGTAPTDLARKGTAAAAAGFVNFLGYMGAATGDVVTGSLLKHYNWHVVIQVWAGWAFAAAIASALLWNRSARSE
jgi:sugar phosphate permease